MLLNDPHCPVDSAVLEVLTSLLDTLRTAGARIEDVQPPAPLSQSDPLFQQTLAGVTAPFLPAANLQFLQAVAEGADPVGPVERPARAGLVAGPWTSGTAQGHVGRLLPHLRRHAVSRL